jgi:hypothetical protein
MATVPAPHAGTQAQATSKLEAGMKLLQEALSGLPMGSPQHNAVLKALSDIGKHMPTGGAGQTDPNAMIQQLAQLARAARTEGPQHGALAGMMGGGAPPAGPIPGAGAPPPAPPMGG